jgi:hypothetical protein
MKILCSTNPFLNNKNMYMCAYREREKKEEGGGGGGKFAAF